jgi:hypothetical protein
VLPKLLVHLMLPHMVTLVYNILYILFLKNNCSVSTYLEQCCK